jgi:hypothetical protein
MSSVTSTRDHLLAPMNQMVWNSRRFGCGQKPSMVKKVASKQEEDRRDNKCRSCCSRFSRENQPRREKPDKFRLISNRRVFVHEEAW